MGWVKLQRHHEPPLKSNFTLNCSIQKHHQQFHLELLEGRKNEDRFLELHFWKISIIMLISNQVDIFTLRSRTGGGN